MERERPRVEDSLRIVREPVRDNLTITRVTAAELEAHILTHDDVFRVRMGTTLENNGVLVGINDRNFLLTPDEARDWADRLERRMNAGGGQPVNMILSLRFCCDALERERAQ